MCYTALAFLICSEELLEEEDDVEEEFAYA